MSNDFKQKEPTKTEKVLYELFMDQQQMRQSMVTNSALMIILAMELKIAPEKLAEMLINKDADVKAYSKQINEAIDKLTQDKKQEPEIETKA